MHELGDRRVNCRGLPTEDEALQQQSTLLGLDIWAVVEHLEAVLVPHVVQAGAGAGLWAEDLADLVEGHALDVDGVERDLEEARRAHRLEGSGQGREAGVDHRCEDVRQVGNVLSVFSGDVARHAENLPVGGPLRVHGRREDGCAREQRHDALNGEGSELRDALRELQELIGDELAVLEGRRRRLRQVHQHTHVPLEVCDEAVVILGARLHNATDEKVRPLVVWGVAHQLRTHAAHDALQGFAADEPLHQIECTITDVAVGVLEAVDDHFSELHQGLRVALQEALHAEQTEVLEVGVRVRDKAAQLFECKARHWERRLAEADGDREARLEAQTLRLSRVEDVEHGLGDLLAQARLVRRERAKHLDDLDHRPVVQLGAQQVVEADGETEVVRGVLARELTQHADDGAAYDGIWIALVGALVELLKELGERRAQRAGVLLDDAVQTQHGLLADVVTLAVEQRDDV
eukprot:PhM_4_TR4096/c0_g1_i2/m.90554